jgi:hypothetical protein
MSEENKSVTEAKQKVDPDFLNQIFELMTKKAMCILPFGLRSKEFEEKIKNFEIKTPSLNKNEIIDTVEEENINDKNEIENTTPKVIQNYDIETEEQEEVVQDYEVEESDEVINDMSLNVMTEFNENPECLPKIETDEEETEQIENVTEEENIDDEIPVIEYDETFYQRGMEAVYDNNECDEEYDDLVSMAKEQEGYQYSDDSITPEAFAEMNEKEEEEKEKLIDTNNIPVVNKSENNKTEQNENLQNKNTKNERKDLINLRENKKIDKPKRKNYSPLKDGLNNDFDINSYIQEEDL